MQECEPEAGRGEQGSGGVCDASGGGFVTDATLCLGGAREPRNLTGPRPLRTSQDRCHRILGTFTLFKDKCVVNLVSGNTRNVRCTTPAAAQGGFTSISPQTDYK
ncbi:hypothetical protein DPEC_G00045970 [Dallia pectoralis]|uniref:Uncharacterized protein n=1 Tax=Dallia pectoralis TaxID=75939 RepID=A0ACC2HAF2_DALPE|nr:hypothetical protein DPEC_G00045970 [Dallia pectoralis]